MTSYTKQAISYAVELMHLVSEKEPEEAITCEEYAEVAAWIEDAVRSGQVAALNNFLEGCGPAGSHAYGWARGIIRTVGSVVEVDGQMRVLFAIPFLVDAGIEMQLHKLECRQTIERELEAAQGLPFLSLRMCEHPTRRVELDSLGPLELEKVGKDIVRYSGSKRLTVPVIGPGPEHLVWLGVCRVPRERQLPALFSSPNSRALHTWRAKTREWLMAELSSSNISYADVLFPMRVHEALNASRLYQLKTELNTARTAIGATHMSFRRQAAQLTWTLKNASTDQTATNDMWLPDESEILVEKSLKHFAQKTDLTLSTERFAGV